MTTMHSQHPRPPTIDHLDVIHLAAVSKKPLKLKDKVCDWPGCVAKFARKPDLERHIKTVHRGERRFKCDILVEGKPCNRKFSQQSQLNTHQQTTHIKSMVFVCEYCSAKFTDGSSRSRHVKETHLGRTYFCPCCPKKISRATAFKNHVKKHGILEVIRGDKQTVSDFNLRHWLPKWFKADECSQLAHFTSECIEKMRREEMKNASRTKSSRKKGQDCFTAESQSPSADTAELYSYLPFHPVTEASSAASTPRLHNTPNSLTALAPMPLLTFSPVPPPPGPGGLTYEGYGEEEDLYPVTAWDYYVSPHLIGSDLSSVVSTPALTAGSTASTRSSLVTTPTMSGATPAFVDASYASYAEKDLPPPYHLVVGNSNHLGVELVPGLQGGPMDPYTHDYYAEHALDSCAWPSTELSPLPLGTPPLASYDMYDSQRKPSGGLFGAPAPAARGWRPPPYPEGPVQRIARSSLGPVSL